MQPPASFIPSGAPRHRALALGANSIEVFMKKLALSLLGAAAIAVTAVSLLGSHQPAEARSASGGGVPCQAAMDRCCVRMTGNTECNDSTGSPAAAIIGQCSTEAGCRGR
jgi:hypothetical protein